jgi:hypothetical protein
MAVKQNSERCVENDIALARESLADADLAAIRARCAEEVERGITQLVEAAPPVPPKLRRLG